VGDDDGGWPTAPGPERLDRRARLGPFPSGRDAVKFVVYAAAGALVSPFVGALVWVPVVLAGLLVAVWRPDDRALDERALAAARWAVRVVGGGAAMTSTATGVRHRLVRWNGQYVAVVRAGGCPLAYLPPEELARRFEAFRAVLRGAGERVALVADAAPIHLRSLRPARPAPEGPEREAQDGYAQLLELIARRRSVRRVHVLLAEPDLGPEGIGRLEAGSSRVIEGLAGLGVPAERLTGRPLAHALRGLDAGVEGTSP